MVGRAPGATIKRFLLLFFKKEAPYFSDYQGPT
jgi:hypothetical protein